MGAFMSGTDWSQMNDRGQLANYFMMLVVDTKPGDGWVAHVGFPAKVKQKVYEKTYYKKVVSDLSIEFANNEDGYPPLNQPVAEEDKEKLKDVEKDEEVEKTIMVIMKCKVVKEEMEERKLDPFLLRYHRVVQALSSVASFPTGGYSAPGAYANSSRPLPVGFQNKGDRPKRGPGRPRKEEQEGKKTKGVMAMTEKEWLASQFSKEEDALEAAFDANTVKAFLNACMSYEPIEDVRWNDRDPISDLIKYHKECTAFARRNWLEDMGSEARRWLESNFANCTVEEYLGFLEQIQRYMKQFNYLAVIQDILRELDKEEADAKEEALDKFNSQKKDKVPELGFSEIETGAMPGGYSARNDPDYSSVHHGIGGWD